MFKKTRKNKTLFLILEEEIEKEIEIANLIKLKKFNFRKTLE